MSTYVYKKCAKCGVNAVQDNSVKFHRFPKPGSTNILRATAWATYCWPERDWSSLESLTALHKTSKVLCGRHFEDTCYIDSNKKRLSLYSIPGTKEYVIKLMHSLRSKIPSIVQQVKSSLDYSVAGHSTHHDNPVGGTSTQQDVIEAASSTLMVKSSLDYSVAGHSTHHDNPVGGTSTQQDVIEAASSTLTVKSSLDYSVAGHSTHHDNPVGGTSTQQDVIEAASSTLTILCILLFISSIASLSNEPVNKSATLGMNVIFALVSSSLSCYQIVIASLLLWQVLKLKGNVYICSVWEVSHYSIIVIHVILFGGKLLVYMDNNQCPKAVLTLFAGATYEGLHIYGVIIVNSYSRSLEQDRYY